MQLFGRIIAELFNEIDKETECYAGRTNGWGRT